MVEFRSTLLSEFFNIIKYRHKATDSLFTFKKIAQGDLTRKVVLRSRDLLKEEAGQFNDMVDDLSHHIEALKNDNRLLLSTLKGIVDDNGQAIKIEDARKIIQEQEALFKAHISQLQLIKNIPLARN